MLRRTHPSYRLHKPSCQAVVTLNGRDIDLGVFESTKSREKYDQLIAEWLAGGRQTFKGSGPSISELLLAYLEFATTSLAHKLRSMSCSGIGDPFRRQSN